MHKQHLQRQNMVRQAPSRHREHTTPLGLRGVCFAGFCPGARMRVAVVLVAVVLALVQHVVPLEVESTMQPGLSSVLSTFQIHDDCEHRSAHHYCFLSFVKTESPLDCKSTDRPSTSSNTRHRARCLFCCIPKLSVAIYSSLLPGTQHDPLREYNAGMASVDKQ